MTKVKENCDWKYEPFQKYSENAGLVTSLSLMGLS